MSPHGSASLSLPSANTKGATPRSDWRVVGRLLPYLLEFKVRVAVALIFLAPRRSRTSACRW